MALNNEIEAHTWSINLLSWLGIGLTVSGAICGGLGIIAKNKKEALQKIAANDNKLVLQKTILTQKEWEHKTANALLEVEQLKAENIGMQTKLETERAARLRIEQQLAWRRIPVEHSAELVELLKPFRGRRVSIEYLATDEEVKAFGAAFVKMFRDAGWEVEVSAWTMNDPRYGVKCEIFKNAPPDVARVLRSLFAKLRVPDVVLTGVDQGTMTARIFVAPRSPQ